MRYRSKEAPDYRSPGKLKIRLTLSDSALHINRMLIEETAFCTCGFCQAALECDEKTIYKAEDIVDSYIPPDRTPLGYLRSKGVDPNKPDFIRFILSTPKEDLDLYFLTLRIS